MSTASRVPGDEPEDDDPPISKRPATPGAKRPPNEAGRYSLSTEGSTQMAAVRIDSTRMMAVRPDPARGAVPAAPEPAVAFEAARPAEATEPIPPPPLPPKMSHKPKSKAAPPLGAMAALLTAVVPPGPPKSGPAVPPAPKSAPAVPPAPKSAPAVPPASKSVPAAVPPAPKSAYAAMPPAPKSGPAVPPPPRSAPAVPPAPKSAPAAVPPAPKSAPASTLSLTPPSLRPPPPGKRDSAPARAPDALRPGGSSLPPASLALGAESLFEGFDEGSIAHAFDELMSEGTTGEPGRDAQFDLAPVRELFAALAANHMRHVRDFMIDVKWGEAPTAWIEICIPAVASLRRAADRLDLGDLAQGLDGFAADLRRTATESPRSIEGASKERLLTTYAELVTILPQAFALDRDTSQREAVIIQSLCLSVPDVRKVTIDKLHAAGLTTLNTLFDAKPDEVAVVAGIPEVLAQRIVDRFQEYRRELQNAAPQDARADERDRLAVLTTSLREQHDGYEEAARGWSPEAKAKKRELFRLREESWLAISLLLARFGEVERIQGIERVPFAQRIAQLTDYLEEARQKYRTE